MKKIFHTPVLLDKVVEFLMPKPGKSYIDATLGGGGHTFEITKRGARVLGIDRDKQALEYVNSRMHMEQNLTLVQGNFSQIAEIAKSHGFSQVDGILFDLGVSSHQLETPQRGFSFTKEGPLDMRMDQNLPISAYDIVNNFEERRLNEIFKTYGQEKFSRSIASAICSARQIEPINSTIRLAKIIQQATKRGVRKTKIHPATKTFQAIRIVINSELLNLQECLPQTISLLVHGGRLVIISFHSLEDALVKRFLKQDRQLRVLTPKPIGPARSEIWQNPRARSAKLRAAEKI